MKKKEQKFNMGNDEQEVAEAFEYLKSEIVAPKSLLESILIEVDSQREVVPSVSRVWMMPRFFVPIGFAVFIILAGTGYKNLTTVVPVSYIDSYKLAEDNLRNEMASEETELNLNEDPDFLNEDEVAILSLSNEI
jgi:hypothetical protein